MFAPFNRFAFVSMVLTVCLVLQSCVMYQDTVKHQSQRLSITSDPSGAWVSVADEDGSRIVGKTPTTLDVDYRVTTRIYDKGTCAVAGATAVANIVADDEEDEDSETSGAEAVFGLLGIIAGAAAGAATCAEADGIIALHPKSIVLTVTLEGYRTQEFLLVVPKEQSAMHFELLPIGSDTAASSTVPGSLKRRQPSAPDARLKEAEQSRVLVFDISSNVANVGPELLEALSLRLYEEIADAGYYPTVERDALRQHLRLEASQTGRACTSLECKTHIARQFSAELMVETKILRAKQNCLLAISLIDSETQTVKLLAATEATCDEDTLIEAIEIAAEMLTAPPLDSNAAIESAAPIR